MKHVTKNLLRQALEKMMDFFANNSAVHGGSLLTDSDLTTSQIISRALKGDLDVRESVMYRGYTIKPRFEMSWAPADRYGYWVTAGIINVMPGATWFRSVEDAKQGIDRLELAGKSDDTFWLLSGNAGLSVIQTSAAVTTTRSQFALGYEVRRLNDRLVLDGSRLGRASSMLTPQEALALSAMLKDAAERALGKTI